MLDNMKKIELSNVSELAMIGYQQNDYIVFTNDDCTEFAVCDKCNTNHYLLKVDNMKKIEKFFERIACIYEI